MVYQGFFNAGLIFIVLTAMMLLLYAAGKMQFRAPRETALKEPYACGEAYVKWGAHDERLYERLYKTLGIKKLALLHNNDLDEYLAWMFTAAVVSIILLSLWVS